MQYHLTESQSCSIAHITSTEVNTVVMYLSVDIHSALAKELSATALLYTDVITAGAGTLSRDQFTDAQNQLGAVISVSVADNLVTFTIKCRKAVLNKTLALFSLILHDPTFSTSEINRAKRTLSNQLAASKEEGRAIAQYELKNQFYDETDRHYQIDEDTLQTNLKTITAAKLRNLHIAITRRLWTVSSAGDVSNNRAVKQTIHKLKETFGTEAHVTPHTSLRAYVPKVVERVIPGQQNIEFSIGGPLSTTVKHDDYAALTVALAVLGMWGGFTGRLMSTVREAEGLTYSIYARTEGFYREEQGCWRIMTFFSPQQTQTGLQSTFREITKLYNEGVTEVELKKFKTILGTRQSLLSDSLLSQLRVLHGYHLQGYSLEEMEADKKRIQSVTLEAVQSAIKTYLNPQHLSISAAGPINKTTERELRAFLSSVS